MSSLSLSKSRQADVFPSPLSVQGYLLSIEGRLDAAHFALMRYEGDCISVYDRLVQPFDTRVGTLEGGDFIGVAAVPWSATTRR